MARCPRLFGSNYARYLVGLESLQSIRGLTGAAQLTSVTKRFKARETPQRQQDQAKRRPENMVALTETSEDLVASTLAEDETDKKHDSFSSFRGIMARAGIHLPLGLGNHFKPDPLLRHQLTVENQHDTLVATVTPLAHLDYADQLRFKYERNKKLLRNISRTLGRKIPRLHVDEEGLMCPLEPVLASSLSHAGEPGYLAPACIGIDSSIAIIPAINESMPELACMQDVRKHSANLCLPRWYVMYSVFVISIFFQPVQRNFRNKEEFGVGVGIDGYPNRVGIFVGRSRDNNIICISPTAIPNMKDIHKRLAAKFEEYIETSQYGGCRLEPSGFKGHWKGIHVRSNREGVIMAIVVMHPQELTEEELSIEKIRIKDFFLTGPGQDCKLNSLFFQACPHSTCSSLQYPLELLFGSDHITETINGMRFRISPTAFFQLNTEAAEVMYQKISELIKPNKETILLDVCCGTGTIGLSMAGKVDQVIGIERDIIAVFDAEANMGLNNIQNATFYSGTAENAIPKLVKSKEYNYSNVSAVLNPGRGGLDVKVITALRRATQVDRVLYVSCMPIGNAMRNILDLCLPESQSLPGEPFFPTRVVPCDMFPNTDHCELLILFERSRLLFL